MSAFICDDATFHAIVTWAINDRTSVKTISNNDEGWIGTGWCLTRDLEPDVIGQQLVNENYRSVNYRYSEKTGIPIYRFREVLSRKADGQNKVLGPVDAIKLCHCLSYQSCEHPGWESSWANHFLERVVNAATHKLPGYEAAAWGLNDDDVGTTISLSSLIAKPSKKRRA